jgi:hypothetical protein
MMIRLSDNGFARVYIVLAAAAFVFFLILLGQYGTRPCHDEILFINNSHLFEKEGLSASFLKEMKDQAPGPLYQFVHIALKPITGLKPPGIRMVNMGFLLALAATLFSFLHQSGKKAALVPLAAGVSLFFVPVIWQIAGLALTEMPALFCAVLSFRMLYALSPQQSPAIRWMLVLLSAIMLGLSIIGRAPFMVLLLPYGYFLSLHTKGWDRMGTLVFYSAVAMAFPLPLFFIWEGLVPPHQQYISGGLNAWHGILAFAYGAIVAFFIAPQWFVSIRRRVFYFLPVAYAALLFLNIRFMGLTYYSLGYTLSRVLPESVMKYYPYALAPLLMLLASYFVVSAAVRFWQHRTHPLQTVMLVSGCLLLASCAGITHLFSTRYVAQAAPFLVLAVSRCFKVDFRQTILAGIGLIIGYFSLITYLNEF